MVKIKQPLTKGIAKTPLVMQLEALECGAASLAMIMAYYDKWVPLEQLREDAAVSRDGATAKNVLVAARKYGFIAKGYRSTRIRLMQQAKFPCIIYWNNAHFVVLNGFTKHKASINDPAKGKLLISMEEFDKCFSKVYFDIYPGENFVPGGKRKSVLAFAKKRLIGATALIVLFSITIIVSYAVGVFDPILKQAFIDNILDGNRSEYLLTFIIIVASIGFTQLLVTFIRQILSYRILGKLAIESSATFMWKILKLPISFFSQRMVGDIEKRKDTNAVIASTLINIFAPLALNFIILIVYLVLMIQRSYILTLIGVSAIAIDAIITQFLVRKRIDITRVYARDTALLNAASSKGIEMIETIKSSGAESGYYQQWQVHKESATENQKKLAFITNVYGAIPELISMVIKFGILFLGVYFTMNGEFTVGAIVSFQGLLTAFLSPALSIIQSGQDIQEMRTDMERVEDVMQYEDDPNVVKEVEQDFYTKGVPDVEIKNLTFGYNKLAEPLIKDFNLYIKGGSTVAIVGGSGCGKSTLAKLISGLYLPWEGEILFNGKKIIEIDRDIFSNIVSVVDQDIVLFEDTIENNIKMWDDTVQDFEMILAANDASIHDEIMDRGGYQYRISEGGKNFSGGERQRIEIARALANDPSVLILDEATSALDAKTEYNIIRSIERRGVTCIVVAHRLSTIRNADKILVLDKGTVVEQGNHEELMALKGSYYRLINNE